MVKSRNEIARDWNTTKGKLKEKFPSLTNDDLVLANGNLDELIEKLRMKLGKTKEEIHTLIAHY